MEMLTLLTEPAELPSIVTRASDSTNSSTSHASSTKAATFSAHQIYALNIISIVVQSVSLTLAFVAFYWFMRIKRSFRHHLILLLLCCDASKCFWFFIYPVLVFTGHKITSESAFCQVQGFFLAFSLETSDFAIFVIALHAVLYIFRPPQRLGQGGIYNYRYWIYALWVVLPVLAASMAFVNPAGAYASTGTYCFLPKRPFWYRLALSWVPRYVILLTIFVGYAAIYIYVHRKFKGFTAVSVGGALLRVHPSVNDPGVSTIGSVAVERNSTTVSEPSKHHHPQHYTEENQADVGSAWETVDFITAPSAVNPAQAKARAELDPAKHQRVDSGKGLEPPNPGGNKRPSEPNRTVSSSPTAASGATDDTYVVPAAEEGQNTPPDMMSTRIAIQRQLRFLFIYPIVYIFLWTPAFANHCTQYNDYLAFHPPYWLQVLTIVTINIQTGADAVIFMWRERPWQRVQQPQSNWMRRLKGRVAEKFAKLEAESSSEESQPRKDLAPYTHTVEWWEREESLNEDMDESKQSVSSKFGNGISAV